MATLYRYGVLFVMILLGNPIGLLAATDIPNGGEDVRQHFADGARLADADAAAYAAQARKVLDAALDVAMKAATKAALLDDANQIVALRKTLSDPFAEVPAPETVSFPDARKAINDYNVAMKQIAANQGARRAAIHREYIAALDRLMKRAMREQNLAGANQIDALRKLAELQMKVGLGRFPADPVLLLTFDPDTILPAPMPRIADQSGHGNDINLDAPVKSAATPVGQAIRLAANRKWRSTQLVGISGRQPRTLSFWLEVDEVPQGELHDFLSWGTPGNGGEFGAMISERRFTVWAWGGGFDWNTPIPVEAKIWHHYAIVFDGTIATWYIDGKSLGNRRMTLDTVPAPLTMGGINGQLAEVVIYDRALNITEINLLGHHGRPFLSPPQVVAVAPPATQPAGTPPAPATQPLASNPLIEPEISERPINGEFFSLLGQSGLPSYLKCDQATSGNADGLHEGTCRTSLTDFFEHDFVIDLVFSVKLEGAKRDALVGFGNQEERGNPFIVQLNTDAEAVHAVMRPARAPTKPFAELKPDVANLLRFEKKGDVLTVSVTGDFKGKYRPDSLTTFPSVKAIGSGFTRFNSNFVFGANGFFKAIRIEVDGKVIDPGPALVKIAEPAPDEGWANFQPGSTLPDYLDGSSGATIGKDGLELAGIQMRTRASDYLTKDFIFDLVYSFQPDERGGFEVGIGENSRYGNAVINSLLTAVRGPGDNGAVRFTFRDFNEMHHLGELGKEHTGPNLLRFQKHGDTLLISVCGDYNGKYQPDFQAIIPSLKWQAPYLNGKNSGFFMGGGGTIKRMRLIVNGKPLGTVGPQPLASTTKPASPADSPAPTQTAMSAQMVSLAGTAGVPPFLRVGGDVMADEKGLSGGEIRTAASDLIEHDFICDLLFLSPPGEQYITLGHDVGQNAIAFRLTGAGKDGSLAINVPHREWANVGNVGASPGPHLLRVEKRGNTLTFSLCADYAGSFTPTVVRTIPDLKSAAPLLTRVNSAIYSHGSGTVKAIGLSIDGKDQSASGKSSDVPAASTSPQPALVGPIGNEDFFELKGPKLPPYFEPATGLAFTPDGLPLKDVHLRTRDADLLDKDFILDTVFHFTTDRQTLIIGLGADEREGNSIHKSIVARIESPPGGGYARICLDGIGDFLIGSFGNDVGPHLLRIQKHRHLLAMSLCLDYKNAFKPDFVKTLADLKAASPALDSKNSRIFIGDGAVIERTRLLIEGEAVESRDIPLDIPAVVVEGQAIKCHIVKTRDFTTEISGDAPKGLSLTPAGDLGWKPGHDQLGVHELRIKLTGKTRTVLESATIEVASADDAKAVGGHLEKIAALYRLGLESANARFFPGLGNESMLLLQNKSLRRLGPDGIALLQRWELPQTYQFIGERKNYFLAMSDESKSLDFLDKTTMKVTRSIQMDYPRRNDLCLNPLRPVSYVSVQKATGAGRMVASILVVDETNGDVREPVHFVGTFLKASPDGRKLYAGYKDIYRRGDELLFNPDRIDVVPVYGNIDVLLAYDITHPSDPVLSAAKNEAGGNGQGLALSADGRRVAYLSFVGYPLYSNNISAWDASDLTKRPVSYAAKANNADCKKLAFHPLLPIVAAPSQSGAVCFDRESGQVQNDRLGAVQPLSGVHDVIFSPDGLNLILECESQGEFFLQRVRLNLTADEVETIRKGPAPIPAPPPVESPEKPSLRT